MNAKSRLSCAAALFLGLAATLAQAEIVNVDNEQLKALIKQGTIYNVKSGIANWVAEGQAVVSVQENLKQAGIACTPAC